MRLKLFKIISSYLQAWESPSHCTVGAGSWSLFPLTAKAQRIVFLIWNRFQTTFNHGPCSAFWKYQENSVYSYYKHFVSFDVTDTSQYNFKINFRVNWAPDKYCNHKVRSCRLKGLAQNNININITTTASCVL